MKLIVIFEDGSEVLIKCEDMVFPSDGSIQSLTTHLDPNVSQPHDNTDEVIYHKCLWNIETNGFEDVTLDFKKKVTSYAVYSDEYYSKIN